MQKVVYRKVALPVMQRTQQEYLRERKVKQLHGAYMRFLKVFYDGERGKL